MRANVSPQPPLGPRTRHPVVFTGGWLHERWLKRGAGSQRTVVPPRVGNPFPRGEEHISCSREPDPACALTARADG